MYETLESPRLILRKAVPSDLEDIFTNVWGDEELLSFTVWRRSDSLDEARGRLERNFAYQKEHPYIYFVEEKESHKVIGFGGIMEEGEGVYGEGGLCIARPWQSKGYGTELLSLFLDFAFLTLGAKEFRYRYFKGNGKSEALCHKFPFVHLETVVVEPSPRPHLKEMEVFTLTYPAYLRFKGV